MRATPPPPPAPSTLADRLKWIVVARGAESERAFSAAAGLSPSHVNLLRRRTGKVSYDTAYKLAYAAQMSLTWVMRGIGSPYDAGDIPSVPLSASGAEPTRYEHTPGWEPLAVEAIKIGGGKLDWAVMAAGEMPAEPGKLSPYLILHLAENAAKAIKSLKERARLDKKLRAFRKAHQEAFGIVPIDDPAADSGSGHHRLPRR